MKQWKSHPHLRLVTRDGELLNRKYAQSTLGKVFSTGTEPPLSLSKEIASAIPMACPADIALRRYPKDVPHRAAYASCCATDMELRYDRKASMAVSLPIGTVESSPTGNLPGTDCGYAEAMVDEAKEARAEARRQRLQELIESCGKAADFVRQVERRLRGHPELAEGLRSMQDASYVSRMLYTKGKPGKKRIGEDSARGLEVLFGKPPGWMDSLDAGSRPWPFEFARDRWDALTPEEQREIGRSVDLQIEGLLSKRGPSRQRRRG